MMAHRNEPATQNPHHTYAQQYPAKAQDYQTREDDDTYAETAPSSFKPESNLKQMHQVDESPVINLNPQSLSAADDKPDSLPEQPTDLPYGTLTPISLLTYLRSIKEIELYYYLFNQVSIADIADNKLVVSREGADKSLNNKLAEILFTWTGSKWSVIITDTPDSQSLKEKMKAKFMESEEWKMLQGHTGGVTLTDIILD